MLYDFEPYAAFKRIDQDDDGEVYVMDFYRFMRENDVTQFTIKDCQLMMQFYDLDAGGSLSYDEFMKFILPCDNIELRE
jgi:Ca2+-binding EF-hand superfamily protein